MYLVTVNKEIWSRVLLPIYCRPNANPNHLIFLVAWTGTTGIMSTTWLKTPKKWISYFVGQCPAEVRASGYNTLVRPHLEWASLHLGCEEVWGYTKESHMIHHWKQGKDWGNCYTDLGRLAIAHLSSPTQSPETEHSPQGPNWRDSNASIY